MEYIRKQSLLADLNETTPHSYFAFETMVRAYPTEDVAPITHAHWIKHGEPPWYVIECSECGAKWQTGGSWDANDFCGNCGAKMDEEDGKQ